MSEKNRFLEKGGEMGSLTRVYKWDTTAIGNPETWSQSHLTSVNMMLTSRFPMLVFWGKDLITFYNDAFRPSLGNDGKHPTSLGQSGHQSWAESWPVIGPMINEIMQGGDAVYFEDQKLPIYREGKMGYAYWTYSFSPLLDDDGSVGGVLVTCSETTKTVESNAKLAEKEANLNMAIASANLGTWYTNVKTDEFIPSDRLKEIFGFDKDEEMSNEAAIAQIADSHRDRVVKAVDAAIAGEKEYDLEYPITGYHDKATRWVKATGRLFTSASGEENHFSGTVADITARKEEDQRKEDFIGIVSHELKSPLTSLNGYLQILEIKAKKLNDPAITELTVKAKKQSAKMNSLITGFLDVARLGESDIRLNRTVFDMADLVKAAEQESLATVTTHKIVYHPVEFTPVYADQDKIEQVLINFINNAVKYSPAGSTINVKCVTKGGNAYASVADEGIGIPPKDQPHVFDRFFRVDSQGTKNISGFGIGLYICKEIIKRHDGTVGVDSALNEGSTFWFTIPRTPDQKV